LALSVLLIDILVYRHVFVLVIARLVHHDFSLLGLFRGLCSKFVMLLLKHNGKHFQDFLSGPFFSKNVNFFAEGLLVKPELEAPLAFSTRCFKVNHLSVGCDGFCP
jgi:hypothetical protein